MSSTLDFDLANVFFRAQDLESRYDYSLSPLLSDCLPRMLYRRLPYDHAEAIGRVAPLSSSSSQLPMLCLFESSVE
jgi:hypothetical protein